MCIATIETVILTLETLETAKIEFLGVHGRPILLLGTWIRFKYYRLQLSILFYFEVLTYRYLCSSLRKTIAALKYGVAF